MPDLKAKILFSYEQRVYSVVNLNEEFSRVKVVGKAVEGSKLYLNFEPNLVNLCDLISSDFLKIYPPNIHTRLNENFGFVINDIGWSDDLKMKKNVFVVDYLPVWFKYLN